MRTSERCSDRDTPAQSEFSVNYKPGGLLVRRSACWGHEGKRNACTSTQEMGEDRAQQTLLSQLQTRDDPKVHQRQSGCILMCTQPGILHAILSPFSILQPCPARPRVLPSIVGTSHPSWGNRLTGLTLLCVNWGSPQAQYPGKKII